MTLTAVIFALHRHLKEPRGRDWAERLGVFMAGKLPTEIDGCIGQRMRILRKAKGLTRTGFATETARLPNKPKNMKMEKIGLVQASVADHSNC